MIRRFVLASALAATAALAISSPAAADGWRHGYGGGYRGGYYHGGWGHGGWGPGGVAAGIVAGVAAGALVGAAVASRPAPPPAVYYAPPAYGPPPGY
jgi:opacity protein-like surface antigen